MKTPLLLSLFLSFGISFATAAPDWVNPSWTPAARQQLESGDVVIFPAPQRPDSGAHLGAAIHLQATPEDIWKVITNPRRMPNYLTNVIESRLLESAPNRQLISHTVKHPILSRTLSYRYRADHIPHQRIHFKMVEGDLDHFEGKWQLFEASELGLDRGTVVFYQIYLDPGGFAPRRVLERRQERDLPKMLRLLRTYVASLDGA